MSNLCPACTGTGETIRMVWVHRPGCSGFCNGGCEPDETEAWKLCPECGGTGEAAPDEEAE